MNRLCRSSVMKRFFATSAAVLLLGTAGHAQNPKGISWDRAPAVLGKIDGDKKTYFVQNPEMIAGPNVTSVLFSPDSRAMLIARETRTATPESLLGKAEQAPGEASISLWRSRNRRSAIIWRRALEPDQTVMFRLNGWMGNGLALGTVMLWSKDKETGKPVYASFALLMDTTSGTTREVAISSSGWLGLSLSPSVPYAALLNAEGGSSEKVRFLRPDGTISPPLPIPGFVWFTRWSEDGAAIRGQYIVKETAEKQWIAVDPVAMTVTKIPAPPKNADGEIDHGPYDPVQDNLPLTLSRRSSG
ncbi:MAG: hypothetical protein V4671_01010, partial [Armatimonadota bacterium]